MEHKQTDAVVTNVDEEQGIVEAIWAVMGNVDEGKDRIHSGAFTKTFTERGGQVALLDNHRTDSVMSALGTVVALKETKDLPPQIKEAYPDASAGAWGQFQFLMDTPEGKGAFTRLKAGAVSKWSFGYDPLQKDFTKEETKDGDEITVRNLHQIKLYEISPVLFAMNEATATTDAKSTTEAEESDDEKAIPGFTLSTKDHDRANELLKELSTILDVSPIEDVNSGKDDEAPVDIQEATETGPENDPSISNETGPENDPSISNDDLMLEIELLELELMEV
jgi:HK97 family phage prohead protease